MAISLLTINHFFCSLFASTKADSVTVPVTLDHNRIIVKAGMQRRDGSIKMIKAWVDNGNQAMTPPLQQCYLFLGYNPAFLLF